MPTSCTHLYVHFVWSTWDRLPLITADLEPAVYAGIAAKCRELKSLPLEINGTENHVHVVARLHATVSVAEIAKGMKGSTSHMTTHKLRPNEFFRWQGSYGAFTILESDLPRVREYVRNQKEHHKSGSTRPEWERTQEEDPSTP